MDKDNGQMENGHVNGNFEDILNESFDTIPEPKPVPVGSWKLKALGAKWKDAATEDDSPKVFFLYTPLEPAGTDVNEDELAGGEWKGEKMFFSIKIDKKSDLKQVEKHIAKHGIDTSGGRTIKDVIKAFGKAKPEINALVGVRTYTTQLGETRTDNTLSMFSPLNAE